MTNPIDVIRIKQVRGRLLTNLHLFYPSTVQLRTLYRTVCDEPLYSAALFRRDIEYFGQKGYVEYRDEMLGPPEDFMDRYIRLTARGKEIAEGTATDPTLEI